MNTLAQTAPQKKLVQSKKRRGQGMTEYIIIVALIAIAAIAVVTLFGNNIRKVFGASSDALAGDTAVTNTGAKSTNVTKLKTLTNFGENAQ